MTVPPLDDLEEGESTTPNNNDDMPLLEKKDVGGRSDENTDKSCAPTNYLGCVQFLLDEVGSYTRLLRTNKAVRLTLISYVFGQFGEWLTYIASITLIERMLGEDNPNYRTSLGILVMIRLSPAVVLSPVGGVLADSQCKRKSMIVLDLFGAVTPFFFLVATFFDSSAYGVFIIYFASLCQAIVFALYEPCRTSIIPLLVMGSDENLKKATTLSGIAWAAVKCFGSALGGFVTSYFGARTCFCLDACSYILSAILMWRVGGSWVVAPETQYDSVWKQVTDMVTDGAKYLWSSPFGGLVLFKATSSVVTGASDILNVSLAEKREGMQFFEGMDTEQKLGILLSVTGIGCILGPVMSGPFAREDHPKEVQLVCIYGFVVVTAGCIGIALFRPFWSVCLFCLIRSAGLGITWLNSQFLVQKLMAKEMLGRVSAVDAGLSILMAALSSLLCGVLQDRSHLTAERVSEIQAFLGLLCVIAWSIYHVAGRGAASVTSFCEDNAPTKKGS